MRGPFQFYNSDVHRSQFALQSKGLSVDTATTFSSSSSFNLFDSERFRVAAPTNSIESKWKPLKQYTIGFALLNDVKRTVDLYLFKCIIRLCIIHFIMMHHCAVSLTRPENRSEVHSTVQRPCAICATVIEFHTF